MPDVPAALSAALADRYRLEREIGAGGMARVYLARDLKHDREVAIKVLRAEVAAVVGVERFLAEIRTTARLKHPHILPLFDSGSAGDALFYVMPYIDGESLHARVQRTGPLPIADALRILRQVADALAYAHANGVIHRDLKAGNVMLAAGHAFLADFGIARAFAVHDPHATATASGMAIGTPAYMAPEQIVGGGGDPRTDIYALGALGYEILTGAPPFQGTSSEIAAAHLTRRPESLARRRPDAPPALAAAIMACLEKAPERRPPGADDVLAMLDTIPGSHDTAAIAHRVSRLPRAIGAAVALVVIVAVAGAWYALRLTDRPATFKIGRVTHVTMEPGLELDPALSPDGRMLAYSAGPPGQTRIYVREFAGGRAVPLVDDGSLRAQRWPQWSPDGSQILFQAAADTPARSSSINAPRGTLYVATPLSGSARKLSPSISADGAISAGWSADGSELVFGREDGLYSARADGRERPRRIVAGSALHSPNWSPDRTKIAYVSRGTLFTFGSERLLGNVETSTLMVLTLATGRTTELTNGDSLDTNPVWLPDSRTLAFVSSRGGGRDVYTLGVTTDGRVQGEPQRLTSGVSAHGITIARNGRLLLYSSYAPNANIWSIRIPETGAVSVAEAEQVTFGNEKIEKLAVSPDGTWLAYDSDVNGVADIWKVPLPAGRRSLRREFATDGKRFYFTVAHDESDLWAVELEKK
jgi:serine/threonine-protein kinase